MPGLSQLKQFNKDIQSLGDEITIRASRGEKPVRVPIPRTVEDRDDTPDFELGMPEIAAPVDNSAVDDDLSDITGISPSNTSSGESDQSASFEAPDMSSLLNPIMPDAGDMGMPDLSMFMDAPSPAEEEVQEVVEEAPKEISIADMGLEALLSGAGFDGSEVSDMEDSPVKSSGDYYDDFDEVDEIEPEPEPVPEKKPEPVRKPIPSFRGPGAPLDIDDLFSVKPPVPRKTEPVVEDIPEPEPQVVEEISDIPDIDGLFDTGSNTSSEDDFSSDLSSDIILDSDSDFSDAAAQEDLPLSPDDTLDFGSSDFTFDGQTNPFAFSDIEDDDGFAMGDIPVQAEDKEETETAESDNFSFDSPETSSDDFGLTDFGDVSDFSSETADSSSDASDFSLDSLGDLSDLDLPDFGKTSDSSSESSDLSFDTASETTDSFDLPDTDFNIEESTDSSSESDGFSFDSSETSDSFDLPDTDFSIEESSDSSSENDGFSFDSSDESSDSFGLTDTSFDFEESSDSFGETEGDTSDSFESSSDDFGISSDSSEGVDFSDSIPDSSDYDFDSEDSFEAEEGPVEQFSTEGMEDFEIQETDSQLNGDSDDFGFDGNDFEIPGFSDVSSADTSVKAKKVPNLDTPDFNGAMQGKELPPNTLSDEQYKTFIKNFNEYPLNVRLAFENFIVQDEFTDDAEFEIIEKILNKAPARQVAAHLEKMLDISIPVPRDYEHRTAAEYEAYKKSLSYQLRNRIIPFALIGMIALLLFWGIFNFTKYVIVIPAQAESLYKQGYALLEADEYPQSEIKFNEAAKKKMKKKWFFKYARGYRERKQYQRAEKMYKNTLHYFNHDKEAGLEYADMALNDLADYAGAENIVRREILDYHADDPDAKLLLGDIFLEWGTEKDPEKLELAKNQYMNLLDSTNNSKLVNLYNSRMMRYYIRTDKLANVLPYKDMFEPKESNLSADDWTELSGYLLKKLYGPMAPSEEYLRSKIEGLRKLLLRAVSMNPENPVALYNIGNYYIKTNEIMYVEQSLKDAIDCFNKAPHLKNRDIYKYIDSYRLLGENYIKTNDILQAQEAYSDGITLYNAEKEASDFKGNEDIGHLYADLADINYFSAGDYANAEMNYQSGIELGYDNSNIRYRMGYMQYKNKDYRKALGSFIKSGEGVEKELNLLLALGNTHSLREDDYAAEGYYDQLINRLNTEILNRGGTVFPQSDKAEYDIMTTYLYASNNYGVTLHRLAARTGDSSRNAEAIVQFQQSERAWDALTRNQKTMVRLPGSNLAEENIRYVTHPESEFEPSIYLEIPKTLTENEGLN
ncbi:MAG: hypothetical protein MJ174_03600 [Treponema sp.]|nr:hypothetical protein [Treponema sp.]